MNNIREIQALNKRELENGVPSSASWHTDYRDTAYVYVGGLSFDMSEGDVVTVFSQFGEPTFVKLVRDKTTGKSRGFAFLKYEDQRSCDLAVDNLGGATVLGKILRVDHTRYKKREDEENDDAEIAKAMRGEDRSARDERPRTPEAEDIRPERPMLREEIELAKLINKHDDDDPMKEYLIKEKREEITQALNRLQKTEKTTSHSHRKHHRHRADSRERDRDRSRDGEHRRHHHRSSDLHRERSPGHGQGKVRQRSHRNGDRTDSK